MYQTLKGTVRNGRIEVSENVPLPENATVLVTILDNVKLSPTQDWKDELEIIHALQRARGHQPPTPKEVEDYVRGERDSWGD